MVPYFLVMLSMDDLAVDDYVMINPYVYEYVDSIRYYSNNTIYKVEDSEYSYHIWLVGLEHWFTYDNLIKVDINSFTELEKVLWLHTTSK